MTIGEFEKSCVQLIGQSPSAVLDIQLLITAILKKDRSWLIAHHDLSLTLKEQKAIYELVLRRQKHEPIAYILGTKEFFGHDFIVNNKVLIPRPETEELVKVAVNTCIANKLQNVIEIGTGSGCVAISLKLELPVLNITATVINAYALKVAKDNVLRYGVQISLQKQDLLSGDQAYYDLLLANLPYVPEDMMTAQLSHEPKVALFSGPDGLDHYRRLFSQLRAKKIPYVATESLHKQHDKLEKIAKEVDYRLVEVAELVQLFEKL